MSKAKSELQLVCLDNLIWVLIIFLVLINSIFVPKFLSSRNLINIFYHSSALGLLVLGQGIVLIAGHIDLSIESTLAFAPGVAILLCNSFFPGITPIIQIALTLIIGMIVGLVNGLLITQLKMNALLETLCMNIILRGLVLFLLPFSITKLSPGFTFAGSARTFGNIPVAVLVSFGFFFVFMFIMYKTRFGRFLIATGGNPKASYIAGININRMVIYSFIISGLLAASAGILTVGRQGLVSNQMGNGLGIMSIAGAILGGVALSGGKGTVFGMLGGVVLLSIFDNSLNLLAVNVFLIAVVKGLLILFAIIMDSFKTNIRISILQKEKLKIITDKAIKSFKLEELID
ncbi:MAG: ABC transporter permease [Actinobacteria bacterium]|nr:ABC transporter permease [Actinomycetota bacterium]